jgi:hypothetical protein
VLQPDSAIAALNAADTRSARTSGLRFKRKLPKRQAVPEPSLQNRYPQGVETARPRPKREILIEHG